jgi:hypothetical protein
MTGIYAQLQLKMFLILKMTIFMSGGKHRNVERHWSWKRDMRFEDKMSSVATSWCAKQ